VEADGWGRASGGGKGTVSKEIEKRRTKMILCEEKEGGGSQKKYLCKTCSRPRAGPRKKRRVCRSGTICKVKSVSRRMGRGGPTEGVPVGVLEGQKSRIGKERGRIVGLCFIFKGTANFVGNNEGILKAFTRQLPGKRKKDSPGRRVGEREKKRNLTKRGEVKIPTKVYLEEKKTGETSGKGRHWGKKKKNRGYRISQVLMPNAAQRRKPRCLLGNLGGGNSTLGGKRPLLREVA